MCYYPLAIQVRQSRAICEIVALRKHKICTNYDLVISGYLNSGKSSQHRNSAHILFSSLPECVIAVSIWFIHENVSN